MNEQAFGCPNCVMNQTNLTYESNLDLNNSGSPGSLLCVFMQIIKSQAENLFEKQQQKKTFSVYAKW